MYDSTELCASATQLGQLALELLHDGKLDSFH
eukprot:SAG31_NODE_28515_length_409_cov_0.600000_1_plen_31_part_10